MKRPTTMQGRLDEALRRRVRVVYADPNTRSVTKGRYGTYTSDDPARASGYGVILNEVGKEPRFAFFEVDTWAANIRTAKHAAMRARDRFIASYLACEVPHDDVFVCWEQYPRRSSPTES